MLLLHCREYRYECGEYSKFEIRATSRENDMIGQGKMILYECLRNVLRSLEICFTHKNKYLRMLANAVLNETITRHMGNVFA